ncbi:unnamed protein product, partial [Mesorhabditis spiculigera]
MLRKGFHDFASIFYAISCLIETVCSQYGYERSSSNVDMGGGRPLLPPCPGLWQFGCKNGECIAKYDVCDGIPQCSDGSDEWNCDDVARLKQNPGKAAELAANGGVLATTTPPAPTSNVAGGLLTRHQVFLIGGGTVALCVAILLFIRRRARIRAVSRNRRIGMGMLRDDSDEDDILITSMYS